MTEPPVVCAVDPGVVMVGVSVVDRDVRRAEVLRLPRGDPVMRCRWLAAQVGRRCRRFQVEVLAIETMRWYGRHVNTEALMLLLIGALTTVEGPRMVRLIEAPTWQQAIVGGPPPSGVGATRTAWKRLVRRRVELALQARGMTWTGPVRDTGGHLADALGVAIYAQDTVRLQAQVPLSSQRRS